MKKIIIILALLIIPVVIANEITGLYIMNSQGSFKIENFPPIITALNYTGTAGEFVNYTATAKDPNGDDVLIYYSLPLNYTGQWQTTLNDHGIHELIVYATDGELTTNVTTYIRLSPFCGDGICNSEVGETCENCPEDCGECITIDVIRRRSRRDVEEESSEEDRGLPMAGPAPRRAPAWHFATPCTRTTKNPPPHPP